MLFVSGPVIEELPPELMPDPDRGSLALPYAEEQTPGVTAKSGPMPKAVVVQPAPKPMPKPIMPKAIVLQPVPKQNAQAKAEAGAQAMLWPKSSAISHRTEMG